MKHRSLFLSALIVTAFAASGAQCPQLVQQFAQPLPRVLPPAPALQQVLEAVNRNSARVQSVHSNYATIRVPATISSPPIVLRANLAYSRPMNFRLRGDTALSGPELDLGSNDQLFWFWIRRDQPPAVYYCRHDQFATSAMRQAIPVEPRWLIQALGIVSFDADEQHQGPYMARSGRLEIRSTKPGLAGTTFGTSRVSVIDASSAAVLEQHLYDGQGKRLASAILASHRRDPASGAVLPRHVEIQWPVAKLEMTIDLVDLTVNSLDSRATELWVKPSYGGYGDFDLGTATPNSQPLQLPAAAGVPSAGAAPAVGAPTGRLQQF